MFADPYARATGHLWWKTLSDPYMTLEFWTSIHGEFDDPFLWTSEDVNAAVEALQRGEWPFDQDASTTYPAEVARRQRVSPSVSGRVWPRRRHGAATTKPPRLRTSGSAALREVRNRR